MTTTQIAKGITFNHPVTGTCTVTYAARKTVRYISGPAENPIPYVTTRQTLASMFAAGIFTPVAA